MENGRLGGKERKSSGTALAQEERSRDNYSILIEESSITLERIYATKGEKTAETYLNIGINQESEAYTSILANAVERTPKICNDTNCTKR